MSDATDRLGLPYLAPGQAQKELYHNEALARIDAALHAAAEGGPAAVPPEAPLPGQCWVVASGASGVWTGHDGQFAAWTDSGWRFLSPPAGMAIWNKAAGHWMHFDGASWIDGAVPVERLLVNGEQVVGARQPAVLSPSGGTIIDAEARSAIDQISAALMSHGLIG